jgi:hypothetical protein
MSGTIELKTVRIEKPEDMNFILGQSHFIKTVEDIVTGASPVASPPGLRPGGSRSGSRPSRSPSG